MEIIEAFKDNSKLRASFNKLANKTFSIQFEQWYEAGHWRGNYVPYAPCENNKIIANASIYKISISNRRENV